MSKVICDVCGTAYPETATTCPICGSAKQAGEQTAAGNVSETDGAAYTYVKGGRFSKRNVRRRTARGGKAQETRVPKTERKSRTDDYSTNVPDNGGDDERVNKVLVAVVVVLLLAIIAVLIYIGARFLAPNSSPDLPAPTPTTNQEPTPTGEPDPTEPPTDANVPCTDLSVPMENISFTVIGGEYKLVATATPANTTDVVTFASADETIATVSADGLIKAVGYGQTTITVTCGEIVKECTVICISNFTFEFNTNPKWNDPVTGYADTTVNQGDTWKAYKGALSVPADQITWTSDDPEIASVDEKGVVSPVGKGNTVIRATIGDQTASCKVIVAFQPEEEVEPAYKLNYTDVTIEVGATVTLRLTDEAGANVTVEWTASEEGFVTIDGNRITGTACGEDNKVKRIEVSTTYEGETYTCIVRIKPKAEEKPE